MYDSILLPYDGSEGAAAVLHHASELAHWADARVRLLYVADTSRDSVTVVSGVPVDALEAHGEDVLAEAAKTLDTLGASYTTDVVQGNPAPTIVEYADEFDQDLVVMPTHGRKGISRYLVGSVAEKVVRLASTPVLTVRMTADEPLVFPYERVLVPTDGSPAATRAAEETLALAAACDATVHVLSAVDETTLGPDVRSAMVESQGERAATEAIDDVVAAAESHGVETVRHLERGPPVESILECLEANDVHAVGMGTTGRRGTDRILLGSVAEKTVRSSPVPVLTLAAPE